MRWDKTQEIPLIERIESYAESPPLPFDEIFREEKHIIILGEPGSGKTTLLRWLCLIYCQGLKAIIDKALENKRLLPLLVPISALYLERKKNIHIDPVEAICKYTEDIGAPLSYDYLKNKLTEGECIVLLDGLDEIPEKISRINIAKYIGNFISSFAKNKFIITSRIIRYEEIRIASDEYILAELMEDEIAKFCSNWFLCFERSIRDRTKLAEIEAKKRADSIVSAINESDQIKRLAKNPFLLTHICIIQVQGQALPRYKVDLYRLMCKTLFSTWVAARSLGDVLTQPMDYREGEKVLAPLALWLHKEAAGGIVEGDKIKKKIVEIMKDMGILEDEARKSTEKFFEYLAEQTQLIVNRGGDKWGFRHRTFEEFLTAKALIMREEYWEYLEEYSYSSQWEEVFLLVASWIGIIDGREKEVTRIVERLASSKKKLENILHKDLLLAGKIVAERVGVKKKLAEEVINKIIDLVLGSLYIELRDEAIKVLKKEADMSTSRLKKILSDKEENIWVRESAPEALGRIGKEEAISLLSSILSDKKEDIWVRKGTAEALGRIGKEEAESIIILIFIQTTPFFLYNHHFEIDGSVSFSINL